MANIDYNVNHAKESNVIGKKIAETRKRRHMTQNDFIKRLTAYGIEVRQGAIAKWENGITIPTAYQILANRRVGNMS